tara:strand:+ start:551 stop:682 length:132 start_codon:yes stop_codon:yes gene_type:complete
MFSIIVKNFQNHDGAKESNKRKFELIKLDNMAIGQAVYEPGWE